MKDKAEIAYQCLNPHEDDPYNKKRKEYTWWVELMEQKIFSDNVPDLIPVMEWADDNKYKLYYLMYIGLCNGARCFRITNNKTKEVICIFTCNHLMEWVGEIPEEEILKPERPSRPGIPIKEK